MELYWLFVITGLHSVFNYTAIISGIFFLLIAIVYKVDPDDELDKKQISKCLNFLLTILFISIIGCIFTFDRQQLAAMIGWDAIKSDSVQEIIEILKDKIKY